MLTSTISAQIVLNNQWRDVVFAILSTDWSCAHSLALELVCSTNSITVPSKLLLIPTTEIPIGAHGKDEIKGTISPLYMDKRLSWIPS